MKITTTTTTTNNNNNKKKKKKKKKKNTIFEHVFQSVCKKYRQLKHMDKLLQMPYNIKRACEVNAGIIKWAP